MKKIRHLLLLITIALLAGCSQPGAQSTPTERMLDPTETSEPAPSSPEPTGAPIQAEETATQTEPPPTEPAPSQTEESPAFEPTFESDSCPFDLPGGVVEGEDVVCGFVVVPEDHQKPEGPTIRLALVQVKDKSFPHQPDPVILLAGGPGEKTVENALSLAPVLAPLHPNRDLIFFDQRGVGLSQPALECPQWEQTYFDLLDEPDPQVAQQTNFSALMDCRDQLVADGYDLSVYNTIQNAADVDAIRIALGYDQVNLYGGSYGSHLAQAVMRDHPQGIRSVVLSSVYPLERVSLLMGQSPQQTPSYISWTPAQQTRLAAKLIPICRMCSSTSLSA